jgi:hypothetical protein
LEVAAIPIIPKGADSHRVDDIHMRVSMLRAIFAASIITLTGLAGSAWAQEDASNERLLIVNGNTGHVIYDDGRDDLFCVTRRFIAYYDHYGRPVFRRALRCR